VSICSSSVISQKLHDCSSRPAKATSHKLQAKSYKLQATATNTSNMSRHTYTSKIKLIKNNTSPQHLLLLQRNSFLLHLLHHLYHLHHLQHHQHLHPTETLHLAVSSLSKSKLLKFCVLIGAPWHWACSGRQACLFLCLNQAWEKLRKNHTNWRI